MYIPVQRSHTAELSPDIIHPHSFPPRNSQNEGDGRAISRCPEVVLDIRGFYGPKFTIGLLKILQYQLKLSKMRKIHNGTPKCSRPLPRRTSRTSRRKSIHSPSRRMVGCHWIFRPVIQCRAAGHKLTTTKTNCNLFVHHPFWLRAWAFLLVLQCQCGH